ncbi:hypothetical protein E2C01_050557 [Portunus trituberculatus]|uniref:Secreted protein n=1 Tax=Portunus trituberculatus TaxID=210409 RepID=A0A5B7GGU2_PORTR|nr:hypothetical protein [Portunus trituberculatus]
MIIRKVCVCVFVRLSRWFGDVGAITLVYSTLDNFSRCGEEAEEDEDQLEGVRVRARRGRAGEVLTLHCLAGLGSSSVSSSKEYQGS